MFADPLARIFDDPDHSVEESREIIVGAVGGRKTATGMFFGAA